MRGDYEKRMLRVLEHIHAHPDADLSLDALADVAAMSRFHWHRVFRAMTGETCAQAVRRIRLNRAACWLARDAMPIEEIATKVGYPSVQSFGRAFKAAYGMTPGAFRENGREDHPALMHRNGEPEMYEIVIEPAPARHLAAIAHKGPYIEVGRAFEKAGAIIGARGLFPQVRAMIGVYLDDPGSVPAEDLRSYAGFELASGAELPDGMEVIDLPKGEVARLRFTGPYAELHRGYDHLYGTWLPESGRDPADAPAFEYYHNTPRDVPPAELVTDICLPLKPA
ncbi:AraC family transcriptional regulator [Rhodobacteraceae bacterium 10Alg 79]|uniref:AraC family transcriptional regulator n=2 Tax=Rhodalgimonas zhirmunskyi TaxID=2964767 RepID=A0AAJ1X5U8_9RHOB|nr:AraC family transcriptional regulator [Rhodoalgimonas zhirmunskyi]